MLPSATDFSKRFVRVRKLEFLKNNFQGHIGQYCVAIFRQKSKEINYFVYNQPTRAKKICINQLQIGIKSHIIILFINSFS